jgi:hypothetical protein
MGYQITVNGVTEGEEVIHVLAQSAAVVLFIVGMLKATRGEKHEN